MDLLIFFGLVWMAALSFCLWQDRRQIKQLRSEKEERVKEEEQNKEEIERRLKVLELAQASVLRRVRDFEEQTNSELKTEMELIRAEFGKAIQTATNVVHEFDGMKEIVKNNLSGVEKRLTGLEIMLQSSNSTKNYTRNEESKSGPSNAAQTVRGRPNKLIHPKNLNVDSFHDRSESPHERTPCNKVYKLCVCGHERYLKLRPDYLSIICGRKNCCKANKLICVTFEHSETVVGASILRDLVQYATTKTQLSYLDGITPNEAFHNSEEVYRKFLGHE